MHTQRMVGLVAAALIAACGSNTAPSESAGEGPVPDSAPTAGVGDTLSVPLGAEGSVDGGRITVRFVARVSDSRCPANAMCVWQGDASVRLVVRTAGMHRDTVLHTSLEPTSLAIGGYIVTVPGLFPYPGTVPEGKPEPRPTVLVRVTRK